MKEFLRSNAALPLAAFTLVGGLAVSGNAPTGALVPVHAVIGTPTRTDVVNLQKDFNADLPGLPPLKTDGFAGKLTLRSLCAELWLTGGPATRSRSQLKKGAVKSLLDNDAIRSPFVPELGKSLKDGYVVNETCQVGVAIRDSKVVRVYPVATGTKEFDTPNGVTTLTTGRRGGHNSTKYPSATTDGTNMENPLYFKGNSSYAIHGGVTSTEPLSHGCIRESNEESALKYQEAGGPADSPIDKLVRLARPQTLVITGAYEPKIR